MIPLEVSELTPEWLSDAMDALSDFDIKLAQATINSDPRLDLLQREIEEQAILTIARRQPMAVDLREIIGAIRIAGDLERVGDLAKNIAKRALVIAEAEPMLPDIISPELIPIDSSG